MITPAITVLGAVEGLKVATPLFEPYVVPLTVVILIGVFVIQQHGTASRRPAVRSGHGRLVRRDRGARRASGSCAQPVVLDGRRSAPRASRFFREQRLARLRRARRGVPGRHRRRGALRRHGALRQAPDPPRLVRAGAAGAAAELLRPGRAAAARTRRRREQPFFLLAPAWALLPLVVLATAAAIIASQALISGAFSLTRQAIQLGYCPRLDIEHTSSHEMGQVYVPQVNWALMVGTIADRHRLRIVERAGRRLRHRGHADDGDHGRAAARRGDRALEVAACRWRCAVTGVFLSIDLAFFGANAAEDRARRLAAAGDRRRCSSR